MLKNKNGNKLSLVFISVTFLLVFLWVLKVFWDWGMVDQFPEGILDASSRMINGIFAVTLTSMAVIITLSSNLYTPHLVQIFIRDNVVIGGLFLLVFTNFTLVLENLIPNDHPYHLAIIKFCFVLSCITLASILPFLAYIGRFINPYFFIPELKIYIQKGLSNLKQGKIRKKNYDKVFKNIDVLTNIAHSAARRDDRQLIRLVIKMLKDSILTMQYLNGQGTNEWRLTNQVYVAGLSNEGREYLKNNSNWPEAYILSKMIRILRGTEIYTNEILAYACIHLYQSFLHATKDKRDDLIEMHLMTLNSLMRLTIQEKNIEKFQNISYNYGLFIEKLVSFPSNFEAAFASWTHYANLANKNEMEFSWETILYDSGNLIFRLAQIDEEFSIDVFKKYFYPLWKESLQGKGKISKVMRNVIVMSFWETKSHKLDKINFVIKDKFINDAKKHKEITKSILAYNSPMHWEFSDRFLRFTYLSAKATQLCEKYVLTNKIE